MKRVLSIGLMIVLLLMPLGAWANKQSDYEAAMDLLDGKKYDEAMEKFQGLGSYEDSADFALYARG